MTEIYTQAMGPTASAAATETRIGGADVEIPTSRGPWKTLIGLDVRFANVAEDLAALGILELKISGVNGPFKWLIGNGLGGATGAITPPPEFIPINIPVPAGAKVGIYTTFPNATTGVMVELQYVEGKLGRTTYSDMPALTASLTAATRTSLGSITLLPSAGGLWTLTKLRAGVGAIVDALFRSMKVELTGGSIIAAEHTLAVGQGAGSAATGAMAPAEVKRLEIPHGGSSTLTVYATATNATLHAGYSIEYQ